MSETIRWGGMVKDVAELSSLIITFHGDGSQIPQKDSSGY